MIRDKSFYTAFFKMALVLILQQVITLSVNLADNIMIGAYSEAALAGIAAVNQVHFLFQQSTICFGSGIVILGSQYYGKNNLAPVKQLISLGMWCGVGLSFLFLGATLLFPEPIVRIYVKDEPIIAEGLEYLRIVRYTYLPFIITQILIATLRGTGDVKIVVPLSLSALGINVLANYALIYGRLGFPEMGSAGAALATLIARIAELAILIVYLSRRNRLGLRLRDFFRKITDTRLVKDYFRVIFPIFVNGFLWGMNTSCQNSILGHMTATAIAANSVSSALYMVLKSVPKGTQLAAEFFIGKAIGEGDDSKVVQTSRTLQVLFVVVGMVSALILLALRKPFLAQYSLSQDTMKLASDFLIVLVLIMTPMSYQMATNGGIISGGGDTKFLMVLDIVSIWAIVIPLSYIMAFVVKASPLVVLICLNSDQVFKSIPAFIKANFGHWAKKLTHET
ncbi:MAG: MATE family efflux transporter [Firmicutes bacterium]|nr:MATE family efflux transporter [Bacillota bacterium]